MIDLSRVGGRVVDLSDGIPGLGSSSRLSNWARSAQEVLVKGGVPAEAVDPVLE
jgi:hypothetical protein